MHRRIDDSSSPNHSGPHDRAKWTAAVLAAAVALALFAVTLGGTYVYDDQILFEQDKRLRNPAIWWRFWTQSFNDAADNLYRPLTSMSYALGWLVHGDRAWAYHAVNWLAHGVATALVTEYARRLTRDVRVALCAGLLFAVHPIHVEAVACLYNRADVLCAAAMFGALALFERRPLTKGRAWAIFVLALASVLFKEPGMFTPLLIAIAAWTRHSSRFGGRPVAIRPVEPASLEGSPVASAVVRRRRWLDRFDPPAKLLFLLLVWTFAGYIVWRETILKFWWDRNFLDWTIQPMILSPMPDRALLPFSILGRYVALLVAPFRLSPDYGGHVIGAYVRFGDPYFYLGILTGVGWCVAFAFAWKRRDRVGVVCLLGLAITYGLVGNVVTLIGTNFGERLMYIPSAFFLVLVARLLTRLPPRAFVGIATIVIVLFSLRSFTYARRWNEPLRLFEVARREEPHNGRLMLLVAAERQKDGDLEGADGAALAARESFADYWRTWLLSADIAVDQGRFDAAQDYLSESMRLRPGPFTAPIQQKLDARRKAATTQPAWDEK